MTLKTVLVKVAKKPQVLMAIALIQLVKAVAQLALKPMITKVLVKTLKRAMIAA